MARVTVVRSGGFAGIARAWRAEVPDDLVRACRWDERPAPGTGADRFAYEISVTDGPFMTLSEPDLSGTWQQLVEYVVNCGEAVNPDDGPP